MLFKRAENLQAYLKGALYGNAGSGKTYTASLLAIGISKHESNGKRKPVMFLDTETGSDFVIPLFKKNEVELQVAKTRAFKDLLEAVRVAEKEASVLIIDSQTHYWEEIQKAYKKAVGRKRLTIGDWGEVKAKWSEFTNLYLNSRVHIILCGRARDILDWETGEDDRKELVKKGTMMATEKNLAYEPSLMVEMCREFIDREDKRLEGRAWNHTGYVVKDRSGILEGKSFVNPTFNDIKPFFDYLNIGGKHLGVYTDRESSEIFKDEEGRDVAWTKKTKAILMEEIKGAFDIWLPGQGKEEKQKKATLSKEVFGTTSFLAIENLSIKEIKEGMDKLNQKLQEKKDAAN